MKIRTLEITTYDGGNALMNPYTAERREVSENTPPEAQEISFIIIRELLILLLDNRWC